MFITAFFFIADSNVAEHGTVEEKNWVEKKMGHSKRVAGKFYESNASSGMAAKAVDAISKAGGKNMRKRKILKQKMKEIMYKS